MKTFKYEDHLFSIMVMKKGFGFLSCFSKDLKSDTSHLICRNLCCNSKRVTNLYSSNHLEMVNG